MAAGGETPTRRRQRPLRVSAYPASTQRRAALTARALRGAGGSLGGGGAGQTARLSNGRAPWRPARLPGSHFPPTRFAALGGQAGMEPSCSRRSSLPPPLPEMTLLRSGLLPSPGILAPACSKHCLLENSERSPFPGRRFSCQQLFFPQHGTHRRCGHMTQIRPIRVSCLLVYHDWSRASYAEKDYPSMRSILITDQTVGAQMILLENLSLPECSGVSTTATAKIENT
ncbi:uncharacterized protein LOC121102946 [Ursus maritimus]|uniref:Uncharacterized protein LOC121102946 n=1 Tax=Ursus maritimus TaxID=29073 RepID=A0A8M1FYH0_URSMA|nr:uncharacterized protein LOC121102946 [Ursus maritimus]